MEENKLPTEPEQSQMPQSEVPEMSNGKTASKRMWLISGTALLVVVVAGFLMWMGWSDNDVSDTKSADNPMSDNVASFADCVAAGNPIQESYPEVCVSASGERFVNPEQKAELADESGESTADSECDEGLRAFADEAFGMKFCYPDEWGDASVMDAKIDASDTGHREAVRFSATTKFVVGGVSDDWSTTVGRDTACQEPNNQLASLSDYDIEWHDIIGEGMAVEYAKRSLASSEGGYDMTEEVSNLLLSGVCAQGHKLIEASRYRVAFAAFYSDFSESAGILSPRAHMDNANILFSIVEREQYDALLASIEAY